MQEQDVSIEDEIANALKNVPISAVQVLELLLRQAKQMRASDIHIDPSEKMLIVRFRIDGILQEQHILDKSIHSLLFSRLKIISNLRIDEHSLPQDGRFSITFDSIKLDVRVSLAPTYNGENAVLRLLTSKDTTSLEELGLSREYIQLIEEAISHPHGLIIISGPTGSGKTSLLYSCIRLLTSGDKSIVTIEEPIEYSIDGITQIQVSKQSGLTFAEGLRSILRQDPNVIGVGEIRDAETASLTVHAALTGHLVLSTIHATHAAASIPRLITMGVEPYLLSSTVTLLINERLVRKLCEYCKSKIPFQKEQIELLGSFGTFPEMHEYFVSTGCVACKGTGKMGRIGVFEILVITDEIREAIFKKQPANRIALKARKQGMKTLFVDGLGKAFQGIISFDDVMDLTYG